jgi:hypothetical protein
VQAAAAATGWPDPPTFPTSQTASTETAASIQARFIGHYRTDTGVTVSITADDGDLRLRVPGQPPLVVDAQSAALAHLPAARASLVFTLDPDGQATGFTVHQYGTETTAHRQLNTTNTHDRQH